MSQPASAPPAHVLITGALGNLGRKITDALAATDWCRSITGIDRPHATEIPPHPRLRLIAADLTRPDPAWTTALAENDAVIHLATGNPAPDSSWAESSDAIGMTANVLLAAQVGGRVRRVVFASSNHAMGAYKDPPLADMIGPGRLTDTLDPAPGTRWDDGTRIVHSVAYGASKAFGERLCRAFAENSAGRMTAIAIRIGWTQRGDNRPETITHLGGVPGAAVIRTDEDRRALRWFRNMWLSNEDLGRLFVAALTGDPGRPFAVINGVSDNAGMDWDLSSARRLGYEPVDDIYNYIK